ncbi:hypothetical protein B0H22_1211 [Methanohalophilus euhalobius]|uniref:Uncharacterized protein n=2 Tax=Methanohalophilus euhalobius TaxID=51203 RepID=A0A314ZUN3_9EURY|nr:MAG: hypothetical protein A8273_1974 [Methanohalophilus sp. 2-GBenrich]PQV41757.1 hypothetical protein B0H22_1211 [Methanohalophilus euhalobius]RSD34172.1 MAG: hypothetical protein CI953_1056 [Methanohalophilus sp.]RXG33396.1 hypothetical protein CI957_1962 [Methanohalophilus sp. WG1-DM]
MILAIKATEGMDLLFPENEEKYVKSIKRKAKRKGMTHSEIDFLLLRSGEAPDWK